MGFLPPWLVPPRVPVRSIGHPSGMQNVFAVGGSLGKGLMVRRGLRFKCLVRRNRMICCKTREEV